jgi:hypothetical protein
MRDLELDITTQPGGSRWECRVSSTLGGMVGQADGGMRSDEEADQQRSAQAVV